MPNISGISAENKIRLDDNIKKVNSELDKYKQEEISCCGLQKKLPKRCGTLFRLAESAFVLY